MSRILHLEPAPLEFYPYLNVPVGGERDERGNRRTEQSRLEIYRGIISGLPPQIDALIVTSDLQGKVIEEEQEFLLGERLPEFLSLLIELECPQLKKERIGVLLCGDLYATLQKRGGMGDVKEVWRKFRQQFRWVAGVAGNHDDFGLAAEFAAFQREAGIYFLEHEVKKMDNLLIGGLSGVIGRTGKPWRIEERDYLDKLKKLLRKQPDVILLHQSPDYPASLFQGNKQIRYLLETSPPNLVCCGHSHWPVPLVELTNRTQVLNADGRVVILISEQLSVNSHQG